MGRSINDLKNKQFGMLVVLNQEPVRERKGGRVRISQWCECGCENKTKKLIRSEALTQNEVTSCGCNNYKASKQPRKFNKFEFIDNYFIGYTANNEEFLFDVEDFDKIKDKYWFVDDYSGGYMYYWCGEDKKKISMHRYLMNPPNDKIIDHINRNRKDNRKNNLRICTQEINSKNQSIHSNNTSGISGISWKKDVEKWCVRINDGVNGRIYLGTYEDLDDAIKIRKINEEKYGYL